MQSEQLRQRRRERKRLERERDKKASRKAQMCAGDELDFVLPRRVAALFGRAQRYVARGGPHSSFKLRLAIPKLNPDNVTTRTFW